MNRRVVNHSESRACSSGASLVEVLVALAVFAINALAWQSALQLVFAMLRDMGVIEAQAAEGIAFATLCAAVAVPPRLPLRQAVSNDRGNVRLAKQRSAGLTLIEVVIALAIATVLLGLLAASVALAGRSTTTSLTVSEAITVRLVLPALLHDVVAAAGRGLGSGVDTACGVSIEDDGRQLVLRFREEASDVEKHIFAARDGAGRPALYLRRPPHPRQPWIEDVTGFSVVSVAVTGATWARAVHLYIEHAALHHPLRVAVPLLHHPCVEGTAP